MEMEGARKKRRVKEGRDGRDGGKEAEAEGRGPLAS